MTDSINHQGKSSTAIPAVCLVVLALFLLASYFPHWRLWGVNWWAYYPDVIRYGLLVVGLIGAVGFHLASRKSASFDSLSRIRFTILAGIASVVLVACFIVFRTTTHFLGDGYQLLSRLAEGIPSVKIWDRGASLIHEGLFALLPGEAAARALLVFRLTSITAGVGWLLGSVILTRRLFDDNGDRCLFFLGLATGGYMLLFFGYVENYALLMTMTMLYTLSGLAVTRSGASPWWTLPLLVGAVFLHLLALVLLPSFLYLVLRRTALGRAVAHLSLKSRVLTITVTALAALVLYYYLYTSYLFFTFALLPLVPDQFTVEGDWLFSLKHFIDLGNLVMLLIPGLPVLAVSLLVLPSGGRWRRSEYRFLGIAVLGTLIGVAVFNPGIGMPRNWDLFSIVGVPLTILAYFTVLDQRHRLSFVRPAVAMAILLGILSLAPRVASQTMPRYAIAHFKNYLQLDRIRNRNAWQLLTDYYQQIGDTTAAARVTSDKQALFPEIALNDRARELFSRGQHVQAMALADQALQHNPLLYDGYYNLGSCCLRLGMTDSALVLFQIANGLNPYHAPTLAMMGTVHSTKSEYHKAEKNFLQAWQCDNTDKNALIGLVWVYEQLQDYDRSLQFLTRLYRFRQVPHHIFRETGDSYVVAGAFQQAARAYIYAVDRGLDPAYVDSMRAKYPQLRR
ncbi:MAG: tetratricopeptide repeat protein [bacterium]